MNYRDAYEFDPETYQNQGAGGLLGRLQAMMQQGQAGAEPGQNTQGTPIYDPENYAGQRHSLIGRLTASQEQQADYQVPAIQGGRDGLAEQIIGAESGGNPNATNKFSTATGAGQFLRDTWLDTLRKHRPRALRMNFWRFATIQDWLPK